MMLFRLHNPKVEHKGKLHANPLAHKVIVVELPANVIADI